LWGRYHLVGPFGDWIGRFYAVPDARGQLGILVYAAGTDAYAGWSYALAIGMAGDPTSVTGSIYPGPLPPDFPVADDEGPSAAQSAATAVEVTP
jgi:hypothetical protein